MADEGILPVAEGVQQIERLEEAGQTVVLVAVENAVVGVIALADTLRPGIRDTLKALRALGIEKTAMLTGDNPRVAAAMAAQVGLSDHFAGLMPEDKAAAIQRLVLQYGQVAMVGDGVNDAPALAQATVGIAMGGAGTDVALETADVVLMSDNLDRLPYSVGLGRAARRVIIQNLGISLGVIAFLGVAALGGWAGIGTAVLFHEGSTLLVVLNALRLLRYQG